LEELMLNPDNASKEDKKEKMNMVHVPAKGTEGKKQTEDTGRKTISRILLLSGLLLICFLVFLVSYFSIRKENSYEFQLKKGMDCMDAGMYEEAIFYLKQAQELQADAEGADITALRYLAEAYLEIDSPEMAITSMEDAIFLEEAVHGNTDVLVELYLEYMEVLNRAKKTSLIDAVIHTCEYPEIQELLKPYRIEKPTVDKAEGEYGFYIKLELDAEYGSVYYTLDGTEPTAESMRYEGPISLEEGETLLSAVAINKKGMVSDKLVLVYKLNFDKSPIDQAEEE